MSADKLQLLMNQIDRVQLLAEEAAAEAGFQPGQILAPAMMPRMFASDWILELAKKSRERPGAMIRFVMDNMPAPKEGTVQRTATHQPRLVKERSKKSGQEKKGT